jgi:uncharacterized protein YbaR (Trm112 family)/SAM-dependent methyltransferase
MRISLLPLIQCVSCGEELTLQPPEQINKADDKVEIKAGLLTCRRCDQWFPLREFIPELLPDHLRNWQEDIAFLEKRKETIPGEVFNRLEEKARQAADRSSPLEDQGTHYKTSEISIKTKIDDPFFFGPGLTLPFNPGDTAYTTRILGRMGNMLPLLELNRGDLVLDSGPAYAWTTEWLIKMGLKPIGVDICRTYLDIGMKRMEHMLARGLPRPHLVVADIENLPLRDQTMNAILCFDSFHHIPDRKTAMSHFYRVLQETGNIVLAEPDGTHEYAEISRSVMDKYGILEKGMELEDVNRYCEGLKMLPPEQHFILNIQRKEQNKSLSPDFILSHSYTDCNVFVIKKRPGATSQTLRSSTLKRKLKQRIKRRLKWLFIKLFH